MLNGEQLREVLEQSLSFERGILQLSGMSLIYDLEKPIGSRIVSMQRNGQPIAATDEIMVSIATFLAQGGDLYTSFPNGEVLQTYGKVSDEIISYLQHTGPIKPPKGNRQRRHKPVH